MIRKIYTQHVYIYIYREREKRHDKTLMLEFKVAYNELLELLHLRRKIKSFQLGLEGVCKLERDRHCWIAGACSPFQLPHEYTK